MSPEQILGKKVDARSDLYSLGVVFHEMLTGKNPFQAEETFALALKHVNEPVPRLPEAVSKYQYILDTLMAKEPVQRFEDTDAMIQAVDALDRPGGLPASRSESSARSLPGNDTTVVFGGDSSSGLQQDSGKPWSKSIWLTGLVATVAAGGVAAYLTMVPTTSREPVCEAPELTSAETDQIAQLLEIADLNLEVGRMVDPPVSNAAYGYQEVLKLDPCNSKARQGLNNIAQSYLEKARQSRQQNNDPRDTLNLIDAGLAALPRHEDLLKLKREISRQPGQTE
jgi:serine/threonine-protein kinase PpkA